MLMFEHRVHNERRWMTSNGLTDAKTFFFSPFTSTLVRSSLVIRSLFFFFFVVCHCANAMTKKNIHSPIHFIYINVKLIFFLSQFLKKKKANRPHSRHFIQSLNVIQHSNCFQFTFFVSLQVSICSALIIQRSEHRSIRKESIQKTFFFCGGNKLHTRGFFCFTGEETNYEKVSHTKSLSSL